MIDPKQPFFSHATKDLRYFAEILRCGRLICPKNLTGIEKFSKFADEYFERTNYVMFAPGFGYIIDNANMEVAFLFSGRLIALPGAVMHLNPVVYEVCKIIVSTVKTRQSSYWITFFEQNLNNLDQFNHPSAKMTFSEYMLSFLLCDGIEPIQGDSWGPSTYSEGVIKLLYENNPSIRQELSTRITRFIRHNTRESHQAHDYFQQHWKGLNVYKTANDKALGADEKSHHQLLVPEQVMLWNGALLGLCVPPLLLTKFARMARSVLQYIPLPYRTSLIVYSGCETYTIEQLLSLRFE